MSEHVPVILGTAGAGLTALGDTRIANLDVTVSSRNATTPPTAAAIATAVWANATRTLSSFGTLVVDIWAYASRTLTAFGTLVADIRAGITTDHGTGAYGGSTLVPGINNIALRFVNATGPAKIITAATKTGNCQLTIAGHGYTSGQKIVLTGIGGMTELNNRLVTATVVDANTITIGVDSTAFTTYTTSGTATLTDETALQDVSLAIYDGTNVNLVTTAKTNASGIGAQGANGHVTMDVGDYVLRPSRSLLSATGDYTFNVSATGTKYFVATALTIPAISTPGTQTLIISAKELGAPWAVGDAVVITPAGKQVVGSAVLSTAPISAVIAANGQAQQTAGVDGVAVDIGAKIAVKVGDYYTKTITVDSTPVKNITAYT